MSCSIDHSLEDVKKKLVSQKEFLPVELFQLCQQSLQSKTYSQEQLNELFHLYKKYDLISETEQEERNSSIEALIKG